MYQENSTTRLLGGFLIDSKSNFSASLFIKYNYQWMGMGRGLELAAV